MNTAGAPVVSKPPRLLLIEDDESLQRFVALALEDLGIELVTADSVDEGLAALRSGRFALIISDLMMPGRSGFELVRELEAAPALHAGAPLVIFSAGLQPEVRQRLQSPAVWRLLPKPCSLAELEACVQEGLAASAPGTAADAPPRPPELSTAAPAEQGSIERFFGGKASLFYAFRAGCLVQFAADTANGDQACVSGDLAALRHLAHSLKSVLLTLGRPEASALARQLEDACAAGDAVQARALWPRLRQALQPGA